MFAVDARTGKEKWRWDPEVNQTALRSKICCGIVQRGIAMYDGKIIAPAIDGRLIGLDEETGKPVWEARVAYPQDNYSITMAPRIAKGKAIIGVSGGEYPVRGFIAAFDAKTGVQAWKFYTVPGPGDKDPGLIKAAATWPKDIVGGGGGSVWDAISYDPELELVYIGTGNAGPWSEDSRKSKGFDLLYAASIVAVDVNTGALQVALPECARRRMGLRQRAASAAGGRDDQGREAQGNHAGQQERVPVHDRPYQRKIYFRPCRSRKSTGRWGWTKRRDGRSSIRRRNIRRRSRPTSPPVPVGPTTGRR